LQLEGGESRGCGRYRRFGRERETLARWITAALVTINASNWSVEGEDRRVGKMSGDLGSNATPSVACVRNHHATARSSVLDKFVERKRSKLQEFNDFDSAPNARERR
jgi:hypothetical protein